MVMSNAAVGTHAVFGSHTSSISIRTNVAMRPRCRQCEHVATQHTSLLFRWRAVFVFACRACQFIDSTIFSMFSYRPPNPWRHIRQASERLKCCQKGKIKTKIFRIRLSVRLRGGKKCIKWKLIEMPIPFKVIFARYSFCLLFLRT